MTSPHPTRHEWEARRRCAPVGFQALLQQAAQRRAAQEAEALAQLEAVRQAANDRREEFERFLADVLLQSGMSWLTEYRDGAALADANDRDEWTGETEVAAVRFDPRAVGCWPIQLTLQRAYSQAVNAHVWFAPWNAWGVERPTGWSYHPDPVEAVAAATEYVTTPF